MRLREIRGGFIPPMLRAPKAPISQSLKARDITSFAYGKAKSTVVQAVKTHTGFDPTDLITYGEQWTKHNLPSKSRTGGSVAKQIAKEEASTGAPAGKISRSYYKSARAHRHNKGFMQTLAAAQQEMLIWKVGGKMSTTKLGTRIVWDMTNYVLDTGAANTVAETTTAMNNTATYPVLGSIMTGASAAAIGSTANVGMIPTCYNAFPQALNSVSTEKLFFDTVTSEYTLTNMSLTTISIDIYECCLKHDTDETITTYNNFSPVKYWAKGVSEISQTTGVTFASTTWTPPYITTPGSYPGMSPKFRDYWQTVKKSITLLPGGEHVHKSTYDYKLLIDFQRYQDVIGLGGLSRSLMFTATGQLVLDTASTTSIIAPCTVAYQQVIKAKCMMIPYSSHQTLLLDKMIQDTFVNELFVNTQSDTKVSGTSI